MARSSDQPRSRASFREGVSFGVLTAVTSIALGLVSSIVIARIYGIRTMGEFALAIVPAATLNQLSTVREQTALIRAVAVLPPLHPRVSALFLVVTGFSSVLTLLVGALVLGATAFLYAGPLHHEELILPASAFILSAMSVENLAWNVDLLLSAFRAGRELFIGRLLQVLTFFAAAVFGGLVAPTVWTLFGATLLSWCLALVVRGFFLRRYASRHFTRDDLRGATRELPEMIRFGAKLTPSGMAEGLSGQIGTWALGATAGVAVVGAYSRAWQLGSRLVESNSRLVEMLLPTLVEREAEGDAYGHDRAMIDSLRYSLVALLLPAAVAGGASEGVLQLFGPGFEQASTALSLILLVPALLAATHIQAQVLIAAGRPGVVAWISISQLVFTVALTVFAAPRLGATGAALGWVGGYALAAGVLPVFVRNHLHADVRSLWPWRRALVLPLAYGLAFASSYALNESLPSVAGLAAAFAFAPMVYVGAMWALGAVLPRDRDRFTQITARIRLRRRPSTAAA